MSADVKYSSIFYGITLLTSLSNKKLMLTKLWSVTSGNPSVRVQEVTFILVHTPSSVLPLVCVGIPDSMTLVNH